MNLHLAIHELHMLNGVFVIVLWSYIYVMHYKMSIYT